MKYRLWILPILLLIAAPLRAEENYFVKEVRFEGLKFASEETARAHIRTKTGLIVDANDISEDIKKLYKLGYFQEIQVDQERSASGWVYTFLVTEKPVISTVAFEGNKKIKGEQLREAVTVPLYQPLNEQKVAASIAEMQKKYREKRYYLAEIDYFLKTNPNGDHELVFKIKENTPALVRYVNFIGNSAFTDKELSHIVQTQRKGAFGFITGSGKYEEEQLKQDVMRLTYHYLKSGYLKVGVETPHVSLSKDKRYLFVNFKVTEGDRYRVSSVTVDGDILTTRAELLANFETKPEVLYNRESIEKDMQSLTQIYADQGYAFVHIRPLTETDEQKKTAQIVFEIEKGARIRIEKIRVHGNTTTRDKVVRRELKIKEGDIYSESRVQESRQKVTALGFFKDVNFATPRGSQDDTLNLDINVEERPTGSFSVGAGFSTSENFIFNGALSKQNFFGFGWNAEVSAELSSRRQQYLFSFVDPYLLDSEWILGLSSFRTIYRFDDFDRESFGGSFSIGHRLFDYSSVNLGYEAEDVSAVDFSEEVPDRFRANASGLTSALSWTLSRDTRNNRLFATKGTFNSLKMEVSGDKLGGDNDFYRLNGRSQYFQPIWKGIVFKTYGRLGYIKSLNDSVTPLFERYFLGGVNSLRGYFPQSVGPTETVTLADGTQREFVFGGNLMVTGNFELELPIYDPAGFRFVTFFDAGNAFNEGESLALDRLRLDYGFGVRWISPMGPLRFEWGFPIDKLANEQSSVFNFTIGSFF